MDTPTLQHELTQLTTDLRQISDKARDVAEADNIPSIMKTCELRINATAPYVLSHLDADRAAEMVDMLRMLCQWGKGWPDAQKDLSLRALLYLQANKWANQVADYAGALGQA